MGQQIRVVVADDDETMRLVLSEVVASDDRFEVVGTAADGVELLDVVGSADPDLVLLDVRMPSGGAIAARALRDLGPVVVAVSAETSPETVASLLREGVRGYFAKGRLGPTLPDQLSRCLAGEVILAVPTASEAVKRVVDGA